jgi:hypothetical protein
VLYLTTAHAATPLSDLDAGLARLEASTQSQVLGLQRLVKDHLALFLTCKAAIDHVDTAAFSGVDIAALEGATEAVASAADRILGPVLVRKAAADKIVNTLGLVRKFLFLMRMPQSVAAALAAGEYERVMAEVRKAKAFQSVRIFEKVFANAQQLIEQQHLRLLAQLSTASLDPHLNLNSSFSSSFSSATTSTTTGGSSSKSLMSPLPTNNASMTTPGTVGGSATTTGADHAAGYASYGGISGSGSGMSADAILRALKTLECPGDYAVDFVRTRCDATAGQVRDLRLPFPKRAAAFLLAFRTLHRIWKAHCPNMASAKPMFGTLLATLMDTCPLTLEALRICSGALRTLEGAAVERAILKPARARFDAACLRYVQAKTESLVHEWSAALPAVLPRAEFERRFARTLSKFEALLAWVSDAHQQAMHTVMDSSLDALCLSYLDSLHAAASTHQHTSTAIDVILGLLAQAELQYASDAVVAHLDALHGALRHLVLRAFRRRLEPIFTPEVLLRAPESSASAPEEPALSLATSGGVIRGHVHELLLTMVHVFGSIVGHGLDPAGFVPQMLDVVLGSIWGALQPLPYVEPRMVQLLGLEVEYVVKVVGGRYHSPRVEALWMNIKDGLEVRGAAYQTHVNENVRVAALGRDKREQVLKDTAARCRLQLMCFESPLLGPPSKAS